MINYSKLGEYTAFKRQAQDASVRRLYLTVLSDKADALRTCLSEPVYSVEFTNLLEKIRRADTEMRAALQAANQAAALCEECPLEYKTFELL
ncbi:hypothetical protein [Pantoea sp.]|uniref:hypothetical protein n=1 Tax=Pantoea sp. TaxID=69393 RepID=UPI00289DDEB0|nr:hypothetical protein [Pantoea sp.]